MAGITQLYNAKSSVPFNVAVAKQGHRFMETASQLPVAKHDLEKCSCFRHGCLVFSQDIKNKNHLDEKLMMREKSCVR